ncbi:AraC family transcriptional regulator [Chelativorans sp. AA-79]|uniref:AraC family transcriptional regulator n=1 Tax=Chelativorans sp. AA-79 TaxID=3028735 RepID=UPI0023F750F9|nr:AraC family transcriptional regulator [Chelativorans sp. AA-79]WEX10966.1 AraC family transcriptional regulator [Chelativorans sp. AA-79]
MGAERKLVPDYEVIVCEPSESFRWFVHDYPHHLAKWHYHPEYEFHVIQASSGKMMIGDYVGPFEAGCVILTGPNLPHNWVSDIKAGERVADRDMLVQFTPEFADKLVSLSPEFEDLGALFAEASYGLEFSGLTAQAGRRLLAQIGYARGIQRLLLFLELMAALARNPADRRTLSLRPPLPPVQSPAHDKLEIAMNYILEHFTSHMRLTTVARLCGMEAHAFSRFFKKQTGHTFARYVNRMRVHSACTLLTQTDRPITDICFDVGFNNIANFNRQFVKFCRRTPSDYRREAWRMSTAARPLEALEMRAW